MQASNPDFLEDTLEVWQPRTARTLSSEDARQIVENMGGFFRILKAWETADQNPAKLSAKTASKTPAIMPRRQH